MTIPATGWPPVCGPGRTPSIAEGIRLPGWRGLVACERAGIPAGTLLAPGWAPRPGTQSRSSAAVRRSISSRATAGGHLQNLDVQAGAAATTRPRLSPALNAVTGSADQLDHAGQLAEGRRPIARCRVRGGVPTDRAGPAERFPPKGDSRRSATAKSTPGWSPQATRIMPGCQVDPPWGRGPRHQVGLQPPRPAADIPQRGCAGPAAAFGISRPGPEHRPLGGRPAPRRRARRHP